jgi:hypothetical protein
VGNGVQAALTSAARVKRVEDPQHVAGTRLELVSE